MSTKGTHGGKREGAGRKPQIEGQKRDKVFSIRLTAEEKAILEASAAKTWARDVLVQFAKKRR